MYNSDYTSIIGGCGNDVEGSDYSLLLGGRYNCLYQTDCSVIIGGYGNTICSYYGTTRASSILGGCCNIIANEGGFVHNSSIVGGCSNEIRCNSCNSTIIGSLDSSLCCSCNSTIIGGTQGYLCCQNDTILLNGTTWLNQTVETSLEDSISSGNKEIDFRDGAIKYLSSLSSDFQVDFINFPNPVIANSVITYTLILNQGASPYMITGVTINGGGTVTIKWYNGAVPEGTANQVDTIGLMFIYNSSGVLSQVLGQLGTFV
jgi:hypothetical protein